MSVYCRYRQHYTVTSLIHTRYTDAPVNSALTSWLARCHTYRYMYTEQQHCYIRIGLYTHFHAVVTCIGHVIIACYYKMAVLTLHCNRAVNIWNSLPMTLTLLIHLSLDLTIFGCSKMSNKITLSTSSVQEIDLSMTMKFLQSCSSVSRTKRSHRLIKACVYQHH